ncbi:hypothetical protein [Ancylomarina sp.]|uniref:hypothetical protein n=1 Tax=Ancylomarina sp. TaxID=1970196 RepID=UPI003568087E
MDFRRLLKLKGLPINKAISDLKQIRQFPDILEWQKEQAWKIYKYHCEFNPFYQNLGKNLKERWEDIPILSKSDLSGDYRTKLPIVDGSHKWYVENTSGSSGQPLVFAKDRYCHALAWALIEERYNRAGIALNDLEARFYGIPLSFIGNTKESIKDFLGNRLRFPVFDLSDYVLKKWLKIFQRKSFKYLYGYTNSMVHFAKYLEKEQIVLKKECPSITKCFVTSELCSFEDQEFLQQVFGVPVVNEYGASELGIIGFKLDNEWIASDELLYLEVVDDENRLLPDGEQGRLLCTSLFNKGTPFVRYEVGDLASIHRANGKTWIAGLMGRLNDMAILPSGKKVPGFTFYYVAREILEKTNVVKEYRVNQLALDRIELLIVADRNLTSEETYLIEKTFETYLEKGLRIEIIRVDSLERKANGKFKHFTTEIY